MRLSEFVQSRLYFLLMGAFFGFVLLWSAGTFAIFGAIMSKDPEAGTIFFDPAWIGSWLFVAGLLLTAYAAVTFLVLVVALCRFCSGKDERPALTLGAYLLLPVFPVGTLFGIYALSKLKSSEGIREQGL